MNSMSICNSLQSISIIHPRCIKVGLNGGARGVVVIVVGNEHGDSSSNPRRD